MTKRPRVRYILSGGVKPTDPINRYRLIAANSLDPEYGGMTAIRVTLPDDLELTKYSCDPYSTTDDPRTLEELGYVHLAYAAPRDRFVEIAVPLGDKTDHLTSDPAFRGDRVRVRPERAATLAQVVERSLRLNPRFLTEQRDDEPLLGFTCVTPNDFKNADGSAFDPTEDDTADGTCFLASIRKTGDLSSILAFRHTGNTFHITLADKMACMDADAVYRQFALAVNKLLSEPTDVVLDATRIQDPARLRDGLLRQRHVRTARY